MKRPATILAIAILAVVVLVACASTIRTGKTSIVTITIGGASGTALLKAEAATPWARFKYYLADVKLMPEAYAYIPSIVQAIIVTVTAPDMPTPIVGVSSLTSTQTLAEIRIEVPNGAARTFLVEGYRGVDSKVYFSGTATRDLDGTDVNLPISMSFVGTGIYVDPARVSTGNTSTCGSTPATACGTITYALNTRPATTNNDVIVALPGNYLPGTVSAIETFPLQLKPGMALLCLGTGTVPTYSSVIDVSTAGATAIVGNTGASIDNCKIKVGFGSNGIDDQPGRTKINGVSIELSGSPSVPPIIGAILSNDSSLLESVITGSGASGSVYGVQVGGGAKPDIIDNTISNLPIGIDLMATAGAARVTGGLITGNTTGITIASSGSPIVSSVQIIGNSTGIQISGGNPSITTNVIESNSSVGISISGSANGQITGNNISQNGTGIAMGLATGANPLVNDNNIFCNNFLGVDVSATVTIDLRNNAWNRDTTTSIPGPIVNTGNCFSGDDICYAGPAPEYIPFRAAVPNGCVIPIVKPAQ